MLKLDAATNNKSGQLSNITDHFIQTCLHYNKDIDIALPISNKSLTIFKCLRGTAYTALYDNFFQ